MNFIKIFSESSVGDGRQLTHVWNIIEFYYEVKKAEEKEDAAVGHLTQSFNLDSISGKSATSQQVSSLQYFLLFVFRKSEREKVKYVGFNKHF